MPLPLSGASPLRPLGLCHHLSTPTTTAKLALYSDTSFYYTSTVTVNEGEFGTRAVEFLDGGYVVEGGGDGGGEGVVVLTGTAKVSTVTVGADGDVEEKEEIVKEYTMEVEVEGMEKEGWTYGAWEREEERDSD